jgi:hypothetical protein
MRAFWILPIFTLCMPLGAQAALRKTTEKKNFLLADLCKKEVDLSAQVSHPRKQNDLQVCFALSSTHLFEQYACRNHSDACESVVKNGGFSVMDGLRQYNAFTSQERDPDPKASERYLHNPYFRELGNEKLLLDALSARGVCAEKDAPYIGGILKPGTSAADSLGLLVNLYYLANSASDKPSPPVTCDQTRAILEKGVGVKPGSLDQLTANVMDAFSARTPASFLAKALVPKACQGHRFKPEPPYEVEQRDRELGATTESLSRDILEQLHVERALTVHVKYCRTFPKDCKQGEDFKHSLTIVGNHVENGKCLFKVQNDSDEDWQKKHNGGWIEASRLLPQSDDITWLEELAPKNGPDPVVRMNVTAEKEPGKNTGRQ